MTRPVTEFDLRADEFKHPDTKPEDLEFRADGKIVRKDRWEKGIRSIAAHVDMWGEWEITEVADAVEKLRESAITLARLLRRAVNAESIDVLDEDDARAAIAAVLADEEEEEDDAPTPPRTALPVRNDLTMEDMHHRGGR